MRLVDLEPQFVRHEVKEGREVRVFVATLAGAQGVWFLCPACFRLNGGAVGTHGVCIWFRDRGVPDAATPGPGRWIVGGSSLADLTLSPSIHLQGGCGFHGWITNGWVSNS